MATTTKKPKLVLATVATFKAEVPIHVPGEPEPVHVEFIFKGKSRDEFREFMERVRKPDKETRDNESNVGQVLEIACGWDLEDAWGEESLHKMEQSYIGSCHQVLMTYIAEMSGARAKN